MEKTFKLRKQSSFLIQVQIQYVTPTPVRLTKIYKFIPMLKAKLEK